VGRNSNTTHTSSKKGEGGRPTESRGNAALEQLELAQMANERSDPSLPSQPAQSNFKRSAWTQFATRARESRTSKRA